MSEARKNIGLGLLEVVPIACCIGLPLIAAAGVSVVAAAWASGVPLVVLFAVRTRSRRGDRPSTSIPQAR